MHPANDVAVAPGEALPALRFIACGSVDDGKSTLLGRLLHDAKALYTDQVETLAADSRRFGTTGDAPDYALLLDGLEAEREQGITIDVAYRYFASARRRFIVADTPGHAQYTRNMVTGASSADAAVVLVDARAGIQPQTRRHSAILQMLGVPTVVLAVNKMDLVDRDEAAFRAIEAEYRAFAKRIGLPAVIAVPLVARSGENVVERSAAMDWYVGPTLIETLEAAPVAGWRADRPFAMPVQLVSRPNADFRGYAGRIAAGHVAPGDMLRVLPAGHDARVARLVGTPDDVSEATAGGSAMLTLADTIDCARGDVLVSSGSTVHAAAAVSATLVWLDGDGLVPERRYLAKLGTKTVVARVTGVSSVFDPTSGEHRPPDAPIGLNDIAEARLRFDQSIALDHYERTRALGAFILIDPVGHATVAAGLVRGSDDVVAAGAGGATIRWTDAAPHARGRLAEAWAQRARAGGRLVRIVDDAAIAPFVEAAPDASPMALANAVARLLRDAGIDAVIALDGDNAVPPAGRPITAADMAAPAAPDWII